MSVKLLTEHHLEFLSLKRGCTGSSESTLVKMPHCWKSHVTAHLEEMSGLPEPERTVEDILKREGLFVVSDINLNLVGALKQYVKSTKRFL